MIKHACNTFTASSYDKTQNQEVDAVRGSVLTDLQMSSLTKPMDSTLMPLSIRDDTQHEISTMLERPVFLPSFQWTSTSPVLPFNYVRSQFDARAVNHLQEYDFPQAVFENSAIHVDKLKNFQYMKADLEIEVKISPNPNLRGALLIVYKPYNGDILPFRRFGNQFMASQTSFPHKILNMEEVNSAKLVVPYANIYDYFDLSTPENQFGTLAIYVLSPLVGTESSASTSVAVNCRFIRPTYKVPTANDVLPVTQLQFARETIKKLRSFAQSDTGYVSAPDSREATTPGPVSKVATGVSMISDVLSQVPVVGKVASTVAWISRIVAHTAAAFGLSKPITIDKQCKSIIKPNSTMMHVEGTDDSTTLALLQDNGIDGSSFIPSVKDEMSFKHILARPNIFHAFQVDPVSFSGRKLMGKWEVSPFSEHQYKHQGSTDVNTLYLGSFAFTCINFATLWKGTIIYDIHMIKTVFHRGRFVVVFLPETNMADVPEVLNESITKCYSVVVNLQDRQDEQGRTTIRIAVPYTANTPWRNTFNLTNGAPDAGTLATKTGCLAVYALNDLSVNETVADKSMAFYIAHSAGEDFALGRPTIQLAPGYTGVYAETDHGEVFIPEDDNLLVPSHSYQDVSAGTTGEYYTSLRQIIKRAGKAFELTPSDSYLGIKLSSFREQSGLNGTGTRDVGTEDFPLKGIPTPFYMASFLYTFYNGSTHAKIFPATPGSTCDAYLKYSDVSTYQAALPENDSIGQPVFQQNQQTSNCFEIRTPWYRAIRGDAISSSLVPILGDVITCMRTRDRTGYGSQNENADVYESAGDDFNFYFLRGPPPMVSVKQANIPFPILPYEGTLVTLSFTNCTVQQGSTANVVQILGFTADPELDTTRDHFYRIQSDFPVELTSVGGTITDDTLGNYILQCVAGVLILSRSYTASFTLDPASTQATWRTYSSAPIRTAYPLA